MAVLLSDEVAGEYKELLNSVIASADLAVADLSGKVELAQTELTAVQEEFAKKETTLNAEMEDVKKEFGSAKQTTEEAAPLVQEELTLEQRLAANVAALKKNKSA